MDHHKSIKKARFSTWTTILDFSTFSPIHIFQNRKNFPTPQENLASISSYGRFRTMTINEIQPIFGF